MAINSVALVAHDHKKIDLADWALFNKHHLKNLQIYASGTTGRMLAEKLELNITCLLSGPLGGDQQIGAKIAEGEIDLLIFFWDPLEPMPHDPDIKALLRVAALWNIPVACNQASADWMIVSPCLTNDYQKKTPDFSSYTSRPI